MNESRTVTTNHLLYISSVNDSINMHINNMKTALKHSNRYVTPPPANESQRPKRLAPLIPLIVSGIFQAGKLGVDIWRTTRIESLQRALDHVTNSQLTLYKQITAFEHKQIIFNEATNSRFNNLNTRIHRALEQIQRLSADRRMILQLLTETNTYNSYARTAFGLLSLYAQEVQRFSLGMNNLIKGYLPSEMISTHQLQQILHDTTDALNDIPGDFVLISPHASSYYTKPNVLYTYHDDSILIQLPAFLRKVNQRPMHLFTAKTVHVPWHSLHETAPIGDFTQLVLSHNNIAIHDHTYALLHNSEIQSCISDESLLICPFKFVYTNKNRPTCMSTLIYDEPLDTIVKHCDFRYYHNFKPPPAILSSDTAILLSGFELPFHFRCAHDQQPLRYTGPAFTVIEKSHLCGCDLVSHDIFLSAHNTGQCPSKINEFAPKYVINSAIVGIFNTLFNSSQIQDVSTLYDAKYVPTIEMPTLTVTQSEMHDVLFNQSEELQTDLKHVYETFRDTHEMFLTPNAKILAEANTRPRKLSPFYIMLISFGGILLAPILALGCHTMIQRYSRKSTLKSVAILTALPGAAASAISNDVTHIDDTLSAAAFHATVIASIALLLYAARYFLSNTRITRYFLPQVRHLSQCYSFSDIYCEIADGLNASVLYVCSLHVHASHVQLRSEHTTQQPYLISHKRNLMFDTLEIDWQTARLDMITLHESLTIPSTVTVPLLATRKVRATLTRQHTVRLFLVSDGIIYTSIGPTPRNCYEHWLDRPQIPHTSPNDTLPSTVHAIYPPLNTAEHTVENKQ
jgi:hypothetical protein